MGAQILSLLLLSAFLFRALIFRQTSSRAAKVVEKQFLGQAELGKVNNPAKKMTCF
jgi:hypothetical protein